MSEIFDKLKESIKEFPTQSGVYLMKNNLDKIIYVGKAKNVRNRVKSYFQDSKDHSTKTKALVLNICEIEYILTKTEVEAFLLEASLIKKLEAEGSQPAERMTPEQLKATMVSEYAALVQQVKQLNIKIE